MTGKIPLLRMVKLPALLHSGEHLFSNHLAALGNNFRYEDMREPYQSGSTGTGPGSSGCTGFGFRFGWTWFPDFRFGSGTGYRHVEKTGSGYGNGFGLPKMVPMPRSRCVLWSSTDTFHRRCRCSVTYMAILRIYREVYQWLFTRSPSSHQLNYCTHVLFSGDLTVRPPAQPLLLV